MLNALTDYVQTIAENKDITLSNIQTERIAYALLEDEEIWDTVNTKIEQKIQEVI